MFGRKRLLRENKGESLPLSYPFDWSGLDDFSYPLDDNGVPQVVGNSSVGLQHNPITIAQYGLSRLQRFAVTQNEGEVRPVLNAVNWLVENFRDWRNGIGAWIYNFDLDFYGPQAPWISGMAQGQGISLLLRIHQLQPDEKLLDICRRAFRVFLHPVAEGGVVAAFPDSATVFEEYPTNPPSLVLNGHIFALFGVNDYAQFFDDREAKELFAKTVMGLKNNLRRYDTGYWNRYDLHPTERLASPMYVRVHIRLLRILANLTGEQFFENYADKWQGYHDDAVCRARWLIGKTVEKIRLKM
jgi:hypothetical protein